MLLVIADTGPVNYLILIGQVNVLPILFQKIVVPFTVRDELMAAPLPVRHWVAKPPEWLHIVQSIHVYDTALDTLMKASETRSRWLLSFTPICS